MHRVHFIGVSGIGMSAAAYISIESGMEVSGSSNEKNEQTKRLADKGMRFFLGHKEEQILNPDAVVVSAAVPPDNAEVIEARRRHIPVYLYSEYLGMLMDKKKGIAVAGTHGKTTTTAMLASILADSRLDPTVVCGGVMKEFSSNALYGRGEYFIAEACEFKRSFLDLKKWYSIITNIESEHLDYYRDIDEIKSAFMEFLSSTDKRGFSVVNGDDENVRDIIGIYGSEKVFTVGFRHSNMYTIDPIRRKNGFYAMDLLCSGKKLMTMDIPLPGLFNCVNAALAAVCALNMDIDRDTIKNILEGFNGTERRFDYLGTVDENPVYSDYAHHPTEIRSSIYALRERYPSKRIITVFQPHQYSRTKFFFMEFVHALQTADFVIITEVYKQRDPDNIVNPITGRDLYIEVKKEMSENAVYVKEKRDLVSYLHESGLKDGVIVFMGAGDIDIYAREYIK